MKVLQRPFGALGLYFHLSDKKMRPLLQFNLLQNSCASKSTLSSHRGMGISAHTHAQTFTRMYICVHVCTHTCTYTGALCVQVCVCVYRWTHECVCTHVHTDAHSYACTCTHTHICIVQPHGEPASPKGSHARHSQTLLQGQWPGHQLQLRQGRADGGSGEGLAEMESFPPGRGDTGTAHLPGPTP